MEKPNIPPSIKILNFKLYLVGKAGVGKTSLVSYLSGVPDWTNVHHQGETPGVRATQIYWPARIQSQLLMFQLDLWDSGETASKKYGHIMPVSQDFMYYLFHNFVQYFLSLFMHPNIRI